MRFIIKVYLFLKCRRLKKKVLLKGTEHRFNRHSRISFVDGAKKTQVVLHDHVDMYGTLVVSNEGQIVMGDYSKIGTGSKILAVNKVVIGKYTAIAENTSIVDNNNHPINPSYRKRMRIKTL